MQKSTRLMPLIIISIIHMSTTQTEAMQFVYVMASIYKGLAQRIKTFPKDIYENLKHVFAQVVVTHEIEVLVNQLLRAKSPVILIGQDIIQNSDFEAIFAMVQSLLDITCIKGGFLSIGANAKGALLTNFAMQNDSNASSYSSSDILSGRKKVSLLAALHTELEKDSLLGSSVIKHLNNIDIVVSLSTHCSSAMLEYSDIILPITTHYETDGTFVNICGKEQSFNAACAPYMQSKPAWKVLRVLGNLLKLNGFEYQTNKDVINEWKNTLSANTGVINYTLPDSLPDREIEPSIMLTQSIYRQSSLVRRSTPLQEQLTVVIIQQLKFQKKLLLI